MIQQLLTPFFFGIFLLAKEVPHTPSQIDLPANQCTLAIPEAELSSFFPPNSTEPIDLNADLILADTCRMIEFSGHLCDENYYLSQAAFKRNKWLDPSLHTAWPYQRLGEITTSSYIKKKYYEKALQIYEKSAYEGIQAADLYDQICMMDRYFFSYPTIKESVTKAFGIYTKLLGEQAPETIAAYDRLQLVNKTSFCTHEAMGYTALLGITGIAGTLFILKKIKQKTFCSFIKGLCIKERINFNTIALFTALMYGELYYKGIVIRPKNIFLGNSIATRMLLTLCIQVFMQIHRSVNYNVKYKLGTSFFSSCKLCLAMMIIKNVSHWIHYRIDLLEKESPLNLQMCYNAFQKEILLLLLLNYISFSLIVRELEQLHVIWRGSA